MRTFSQQEVSTAIELYLSMDGQAEMHGGAQKLWWEKTSQQGRIDAITDIVPDVDAIWHMLSEEDQSALGREVFIGEITGGYTTYGDDGSMSLCFSQTEIANEFREKFELSPTQAPTL